MSTRWQKVTVYGMCLLACGSVIAAHLCEEEKWRIFFFFASYVFAMIEMIAVYDFTK